MKNKHAELIRELSEKQLLFHLYATQILLLTISIFSGMILFDSYSSFFELFKWNDPRIFSVGVSVGAAIVALDLLLMKILPRSFYDDGGLNEKVFRNRSIPHIALIAAFVAFGEEILFRGVIQTHFGLIISSLIFALVHYRYLFNWFLFLNIVLLSFLIGFIYYWTGNLAITIVIHFLIDFLLGLAMRLNHKDTNETGRVAP